jgi:hypothetical protein
MVEFPGFCVHHVCNFLSMWWFLVFVREHHGPLASELRRSPFPGRGPPGGPRNKAKRERKHGIQPVLAPHRFRNSLLANGALENSGIPTMCAVVFDGWVCILYISVWPTEGGVNTASSVGRERKEECLTRAFRRGENIQDILHH